MGTEIYGLMCEMGTRREREMSCKKDNCKDAVFKLGFCKVHFYRRKILYRYQGHLSDMAPIGVKRKCLQCDRTFDSTGNRKCSSCNSMDFDDVYGSVSSYTSCS